MAELPWTATSGDLAQAIALVQARCRLGLVENPAALAGRVVARLFELRRVAVALGLDPALLRPHGAWWERGTEHRASVITMVRLRPGGGQLGSTLHLKVVRSGPQCGESDGMATLHLGTPR